MIKPQVDRIAKELSEWRDREKLSQAQVAERAGVGQPTVSRAEKGLIKDPQVLHKLCALAGVDLNKKDLDYAPILRDALNTVWDGSPEQAQLIALLLLSANQISKTNSSA